MLKVLTRWIEADEDYFLYLARQYLIRRPSKRQDALRIYLPESGEGSGWAFDQENCSVARGPKKELIRILEALARNQGWYLL